MRCTPRSSSNAECVRSRRKILRATLSFRRRWTLTWFFSCSSPFSEKRNAFRQPAAVGCRNALRFSEKGDEQEKNQVSVHLRLKLKVARKIFRRDLTHSAFELERGVQRMIQFFNKRDQRSDIPIPQPGARIVLFQLVNQPPRIIDADIKLVAGSPHKCARKLAQFPGRCPCEHRQLRAPRP